MQEESARSFRRRLKIGLHARELTWAANQPPLQVSDLQRLTNLQSLILTGYTSLSFLKSESNDVASTTITQLSIQGTLITTPPEIYRFPSLTELKLADSNLLSFSPPSAFGLSFRWRRLTKINLSRNRLTSLPEELPDFAPNLQSITCTNNRLTVLQPSLFLKLRNTLTQLDFHMNHLQNIPDELTCLEKLTSLSLPHNQLRQLPEDLWTLPCLTFVDVMFNRLESLPSLPTTSQRLSPLIGLKVNSQSQQLRELPLDFGRFTMLESLSLFYTAIGSVTQQQGQQQQQPQQQPQQQIPQLQWMSQLTSLTDLQLANTNLHYFPTELLALSNLTELSLNDNPIPSLPEDLWLRLSCLQSLRIGSCQLTEIPSIGLTRMTSLTALLLDNNPEMTTLPFELTKLSLQYLSVPSTCLSKNDPDGGGSELFDSKDVEHVYQVNSLMDISSCIIANDPSAFHLAVLPIELKDRLEAEKKVCAGCGRGFFGHPRVRARNVRSVGGSTALWVWTVACFCTPKCVEICKEYCVTNLFGDQDEDW